MTSEIDRLARIVWDYHHLHHRLEWAAYPRLVALGFTENLVPE